MRGRLIFPFIVELGQLDTSSIDDMDPDDEGGLVSGYNEHLREPVRILPNPSAQTGEAQRFESLIQVRAQIEPSAFQRLEQLMSGDSPSSRFAIVCHFRDLEQAGLVDAVTGLPLIRKHDRLTRILTTRGDLVHIVPDPPGLFVHEVQSRGFGPGGKRNLLLINFQERERSTRSAAS